MENKYIKKSKKKKKKLSEEENKNDLLKQKIEELEKQLKEEKEKNMKEKNVGNTNNNFTKKELNELSENYNKKIEELNNQIESKIRENSLLIKELSRYPITLLDNERLISIIFCSFDENIEYPIICKNTEKFKRLEKLFYIKYPEYANKIL